MVQLFNIFNLAITFLILFFYLGVPAALLVVAYNYFFKKEWQGVKYRMAGGFIGFCWIFTLFYLPVFYPTLRGGGAYSIPVTFSFNLGYMFLLGSGGIFLGYIVAGHLRSLLVLSMGLVVAAAAYIIPLEMELQPDHIIQSLSSSTISVQESTLDKIKNYNVRDQKVKEAIFALILDKNREAGVRRKAMDLLVYQKEKASITPIAVMARDSENPAPLRQKGIEALGELAGRNNLTVFIDFLKDKVPYHRDLAANILMRQGDRTMVPYLVRLYQEKDSDALTRFKVLEVLDRLAQPQDGPLLVPLLNDPEPFNRGFLASILLKLKGEQLTSALLDLLITRPSGGVEETLFYVLSQLKDEKSIEPILDYMTDVGIDASRREKAAYTLIQIHLPERTIPLLKERIQKEKNGAALSLLQQTLNQLQSAPVSEKEKNNK